jgi:hypothetical protein
MDQYEKVETRKKFYNSSAPDIDELCNLIDENTFGLKTISLSKYNSVPSYQIKTFHSTRLKRLHSSSIIKTNNDQSSYRTYSIVLNRFRSLSTSNLPQSTSTINFSPELITKDENNSSLTIQSDDIRRSTIANSCNVEELAAYFDDFLYLPKSLSGAAELMYT